MYVFLNLIFFKFGCSFFEVLFCIVNFETKINVPMFTKIKVVTFLRLRILFLTVSLRSVDRFYWVFYLFKIHSAWVPVAIVKVSGWWK